MKSYLFPLLGVTAMLGACATSPTGGTTIGGIDIATVQADAVAACSYLPTAATVAAIISANNPVAITAIAVATAICQAVAPGSVVAAAKKATRKASFVYIPPTLVIQGNFVR